MAGGSLIREARLRSGLTQAELAERLGFTRATLARWETGRTRTSLEDVTAAVVACGLDLQLRLVPYDEEARRILAAWREMTPDEIVDQIVHWVNDPANDDVEWAITMPTDLTA